MVQVASIVKRLPALQTHGIGDTHRRHALAHRDTIDTGKRSEGAIERTVLLHDDDDLVELPLRTSHLTSEIRSAEIGCPPALGDQLYEHGHEPDGEHTIPRARDPVHRPTLLEATASTRTRAVLSWTLEAAGGARLRRFPE